MAMAKRATHRKIAVIFFFISFHPLICNGGVFVLQPYAKEKLNETYNQETEEATLEGMHARIANQFMNDLYLNANVKDSRYLYF